MHLASYVYDDIRSNLNNMVTYFNAAKYMLVGDLRSKVIIVLGGQLA